MNDEKATVGSLRIWRIPQIPGKAFTIQVETLVEAKLLLGAFDRYDLFQVENGIKPDYCSASGLQIYESDGEGGLHWSDWYTFDGEAIHDLALDTLRKGNY